MQLEEPWLLYSKQFLQLDTKGYTKRLPKEWVDRMTKINLEEARQCGAKKLPPESKLTFEDDMDFATLETAAEYCRYEILTDMQMNFQKYYELIPDSELPGFCFLVNHSLCARLAIGTFNSMSIIGERENLPPIPLSEAYRFLPFWLPEHGWNYEWSKEELPILGSPRGLFGTDNYDLGEENRHYTFSAAIVFLIAEPHHTFKLAEHLFDAGRRQREMQHRFYCGAIRKYLEVMDGVKVEKRHFSEPSNVAIIRTYLSVHDPRKRE